MRARFLKSLVIGAAIAAILVLFEATHQHAALMATAARSHGHQTVASILVDGFIGMTVGVAVVVFVLSTLGARRQARGQRQRQGRVERRRPRVSAGR